MIHPESLQYLRCPVDPARETPLALVEGRLVCERCDVRFQTPEGIPNLVVEEAILPDGCTHVRQLPCRRPTSPRT